MADPNSTAYDPRLLPREESLAGPSIVYIAYLLAIPTASISAICGLVAAYALKDGAGPMARSHYVLQIRTFWWTLLFMVLGAVLVLVGIPLSLVLVGIPVMVAGALLAVGAKLWFIVRCVIGLIRAVDGRPQPNARGWGL